MAIVNEASLEAQLEELEEKTPWFEAAKTMARKQPVGVAGLIIVLLMVFASIFAPILTPFHPEFNSFENMLTPPNATYLMGTDQFGRDIFTRIIYGAQTALFVGFSAATIGAFAGLVLGVASAYFGGTFDLVLQRVMDVFMAFPLIILALR